MDIDECLSKPCKNHALCHNIQGSYLCECQPGFTGGDCDSNIDDCLSSEYWQIVLCVPVLPGNNFALLLMTAVLMDIESSFIISSKKRKKPQNLSFVKLA